MARVDLSRSLPVALLRAAHPRQTLLTAVGMAAVAALSSRPTREVGLVLVTVLIGQAILGWHNDVVDRARDARHDVPRKPVAQRQIDAGTVVFAMCVAILLLIPLAVSHGVTAGACYLVAVVLGLLANVAFRASFLSWLPWATSFALYAAFLAYGGWDGEGSGSGPTVVMVVLAALLGVGVHFLKSLPGLVRDNADGVKSLPLRVALRTGAPKLMILTISYLAGLVVVIIIMGQAVGLRQ